MRASFYSGQERMDAKFHKITSKFVSADKITADQISSPSLVYKKEFSSWWSDPADPETGAVVWHSNWHSGDVDFIQSVTSTNLGDGYLTFEKYTLGDVATVYVTFALATPSPRADTNTSLFISFNTPVRDWFENDFSFMAVQPWEDSYMSNVPFLGYLSYGAGNDGAGIEIDQYNSYAFGAYGSFTVNYSEVPFIPDD